MYRLSRVSKVLVARNFSSSRNARQPVFEQSSSSRWLQFGAAAGLVAAGAVAYQLLQDDDEKLLIQPAYAAIFGGDAKPTGSVPLAGVPGTKDERTFIAIKPDGVNRGLIGEIVKRFEAKGYKLVGIKVVKPTKDFAEKHYSDLAKKPFFPSLVEYFSSGPVVAMVWQGKDVISGGRQLVGATNPQQAAPGSIRGDLCISIGRNIIHGSDSAESADKEISLWFGEKEVADWSRGADRWIYEDK